MSSECRLSPMTSNSLRIQMIRIFRMLWCLLALVLNVPAIAQQSTTENFRITTTHGREVLVLPSHETSTQMQLELGPINGRSFETNSQRVHIVQLLCSTGRLSGLRLLWQDHHRESSLIPLDERSFSCCPVFASNWKMTFIWIPSPGPLALRK